MKTVSDRKQRKLKLSLNCKEVCDIMMNETNSPRHRLTNKQILQDPLLLCMENERNKNSMTNVEIIEKLDNLPPRRRTCWEE